MGQRARDIGTVQGGVKRFRMGGERNRLPTGEGVAAAAARVRGHVLRTPLLPLQFRGVRLWVKAECLQTGGSFKLRGAANRLLQMDAAERARGVVAFSSGNHAQGVAVAAARLGIAATIVMPSDAPVVKRAATEAEGARIVAYDRARENREEIAAALAEAAGATLVPSFDDVDIIEGQGSCGVEMGAQFAQAGGGTVAKVVVPCGGGGLAAGIALALPDAAVVPVEPAGWDDMARSLRAGERLPVGADAPRTRCDSLQTQLVSPLTFGVLHGRGASGIAVTEDEVADAMRFAFARLRLVVEPGGAAALAAVLSGKVAPDERTVVVLSGGNVDPALYARIIGDQAASALL